MKTETRTTPMLGRRAGSLFATAVALLVAGNACGDDDTTNTQVSDDAADDGSDDDADDDGDASAGDDADDGSDDNTDDDNADDGSDDDADDDEAASSDDDDTIDDDDTANDDGNSDGDDDSATGDTTDDDDDGTVDEPTGDGRDLPAQPDEETTIEVTVGNSALETVAQDELKWFFVVENTSELPACEGWGPARLYDGDDQLLAAGTKQGFQLDENLPAFFVASYGELYRDPVVGLINCLPPGGKGIGSGSFASAGGADLSTEERDALLSGAARIEFNLTFRNHDPTELEPAGDLFTLSDLELTETPEGKIASGTITANASLGGLIYYATLFEDDTPVDFLSLAGGSLADGESKEFAFDAGNPKATRFEIYLEGNEQ